MTGRQNKGLKRSVVQPSTVPALSTPDAPDFDEIWERLRQGARNVAGVTWQVSVMAHLAAASRAGELPFVEFTPEGFEDVDCRDTAGRTTHVQVKEKGAGAGTLAAAAVAEVLHHAVVATSADSVIVLITDGQLGSGLMFTGWDRFLADQGGDAVAAVVDHLMKVRTSDDEKKPAPLPLILEHAQAVVGRTRLVQLPWGLRASTEIILGKALSLHPTVASFTVSALYDRVGTLSAEQRTRSREDAVKLTIGDLDALAADTQSVVDVSGLDAAISAGVCGPADYVNASKVTAGQFYAGLDGSPACIADNLDILRPREMSEIVDAAAGERYAVILGPSGAGKSVLLWRAARDAVLGARVVRVRRVAAHEDVESLVRHCRLLKSSHQSPVVVASDNLGRPATAFWPEAVDRLRELPDIFLLGAARAEDFDPVIVRGGARVVQPQLDTQTAGYIAEQVALAGVPLRMAPAEAELRAKGLLMEFIALLTTGRRYEQVLADQVATLRKPGRELQRTLARIVTAAHSLGVPVPAASLPLAAGTPEAADAVGDALQVLNGEHVLVNDGTNWSGLHELRSDHLTKLLHESPPPTLAQTYEQVVPLLPPSSRAWLLRRAAEHLTDDAMISLAQKAVSTVSGAVLDARGLAVLMEGAERSDNMLYARKCLPILRAHLPQGMPINDLAMMTYAARNQGIADDATGDDLWGQAMLRFREIADQLPARTAQIAAAMAAELTDDRVADLVVAANLPDAVRLLEALHGNHTIPAATAEQLYHCFPPPTNTDTADLHARFIRALIALAGLREAAITESLGRIIDRATTVVAPDPCALTVTASSPKHLTVTLMHLANPPTKPEPLPTWEVTKPFKGSDTEERTLATVHRIAAACPEVDIVEVITETASGRRFVTGDIEIGYRRVDLRQNRLRYSASTRKNAGFQAAIAKLGSGTTWTELVTDQVSLADDLLSLLERAPVRLGSYDTKRYRDAWLTKATDCANKASSLAHRPILGAYRDQVSNEQADNEERETDPTSAALFHLADTLPRVAQPNNRRGTAALLAKSVVKIESAKADANPFIMGIGRPLPDALVEHADMLARLLVAVDARPDLARTIRTKKTVDTCRKIIDTVTDTQRQADLNRLQTMLADIEGLEVHHVHDPAAFVTTLGGHAWVITVLLTQWDTIIEAVSNTPFEQRAAMDGTVLFVPVHEVVAMPWGAKLASSTNQPIIPLTRETIEPYVAQTTYSLPSLNPEEGIALFVKELIDLSCQHALGFRRKLDNLSTPEASWTIAELRELRRCLGEELPFGAAADAVLDALVDHVESEVKNEAAASLGGAILDSLDSAWNPTNEERSLVQCVAALNYIATLWSAT